MKMLKNSTLLKLALAMTLTLGSYCSSAFAQNTISVFSYDAKQNEIKVNVPSDPKKVVVADYAVLDILDNFDLTSRIVGLTTSSAMPDYLQKFKHDRSFTNVGTLKELDLEKVMALEPEVIFIGSRLAAKYETLSAIAPVVFLNVDYNKPFIDSVKRNVSTIATIFNKKDQANDLLDNFDKRIATLKEQAEGKNVVIGLINATQFKTLGKAARCSLISRDLGFNNLSDNTHATHGNEASFELLLKLNPDHVFILDRDSAIATQGAKLAQDVMNNEIVHKTKAYLDGNIHYLNSGVWYLSEGGLSSTDLMLQDVEKALQ